MMEDRVADGPAGERLEALQALLNTQQLAFNRAAVGRVMPVLLDRAGRDPGQLVGRSPYMQAVHVSAPESELGTIPRLAITTAHANSLGAQPLVMGDDVMGDNVSVKEASA
jgi:tRNA-2-methylthio-N6-dimethylallyladenosine synthase